MMDILWEIGRDPFLPTEETGRKEMPGTVLMYCCDCRIKKIYYLDFLDAVLEVVF